MVAAVFFDIGQTLGMPRISSAQELEGLDVYPYGPGVLTALRSEGHRLGIISNTGDTTSVVVDRVLQDAGLYEFFDPGLLIYSSVVGLRKDSPAIFELAAERAGFKATPQRCVFVGEDSLERHHALTAGWRVSPHPLLVAEVLNDSVLRYVRLTAPTHPEQWLDLLQRLRVLPLHRTGENGHILYAIVAETTVPQLVNALFDIQFLGPEDAPLDTDLFLVRDDLAADSGPLSASGQAERLFANAGLSRSVLASSDEGLLVAVPAGQSIETYHFATTHHGHNLKLMPDPMLLLPFGTGAGARTTPWLSGITVGEPVLSQDEKAHFEQVTAALLGRYLDRYSGIEPLDESGERLSSRHIHSAHNRWATDCLARDLTAIGAGTLRTHYHAFMHEGRLLHNVEASLPGDTSDECVLVTAHLDSTAANSPGYDPELDPAPGADDDASGVAAVLAIAEVLARLAATKPPKRTIRFVLFNAEEHGLVGSKAYARDQAALDTPITAVYQMDMIGYHVASPRSFEIHAGYRESADVQARSRALAERVARLVSLLSPQLSGPQIYPGPDGIDPAAGRSDHASFQERGYAACVASEDFFAGPHPDSPAPEANPDYHQSTDTFVDKEYAADIARVIAAAAWVSANV